MKVIYYTETGRTGLRITDAEAAEIEQLIGKRPNENAMPADVLDLSNQDAQIVLEYFAEKKRAEERAQAEEKQQRWSGQQAALNVEAAADYDLKDGDAGAVYEFAQVTAGQGVLLTISGPQFMLLDAASFKPVHNQPNTYATGCTIYEILQMLGAIGFQVVGVSGSIYLSKKMYKPL